jgi:hypothetical protein
VFSPSRSCANSNGAFESSWSFQLRLRSRKDGKLVERLEGAPDHVRQIEAGLERRVSWLLGN